MPKWLSWTMPMPIIAVQGDTVSLAAILEASFPGMPRSANGYWLTYYDESDLAGFNWDFWNPSNGSTPRWFVNGGDIGGGWNHQRYLSTSQVNLAKLLAGNAIGPVSFLTVPVAGTPGNYQEYIQYSVIVVHPDLMSDSAGKRAPTAAEIVDAAYRFADFHGTPVNDFDCHYIATAVAASTGATLTDRSMSTDPTENEEHGFWRIAHRGSSNPIQNWQEIVRPGDIVRMEWKTGGPHTTTVLSVNLLAGTMTVYDNGLWMGDGVTHIGVHVVDFDQQTVASSITIYRLTTDNLYLERGWSFSEALPGTLFNDFQIGDGGNDTLMGGAGNDKLRGGAGNDKLDGGAGTHDAADFSDRSGKVTVTLKNGAATATIGSGEKDTLIGIENVYGGKVADKLTGDTRANALVGGGGSDTLDGGAGKDTLTGSAGADKFVFKTPLGSTNVDTIKDFTHDSDILQLDNAVMKALGSAGVLSNAKFWAAAGASAGHDGSDRVVYDTATGKLFYDADGSKAGGAAAVLFATLTTKPFLDAGDFAII